MALLQTIADIVNQSAGKTLVQDKWQRDNAAIAEEVATHRRYLEGDQDSGLNAEMRALLNLTDRQDFNFNQCTAAVETLTNRLQVVSVVADGAGGDADTWAADLLEWNFYDQLQSDLYDAVYRDGDSYVMVGWDEGEQMPVLTHELAFDGAAGMVVIHNRFDPSIIECAVKVWAETLDAQNDVHRVNVYFPDRVEKYVVNSGVAERYVDPEQPDQWPLPFVDRSGAPIGVPVVQFPARAMGVDGHGVSRLRDVVPLQHGLNVTMHSMVATGLLGAFPINVLIGYEAPKKVQPGMFWEIVPRDRDGKVIPPGEDVTRWLASIRLEQITGAVLTPFIDMIRFFTESVQRVANIPDYSGASQSGEALKQRESMLLGDIRRAHVTLGGAWERLLTLAAKVQNAYGSKQAPTPRRWRVNWKAAEVRNDMERAAIIERVAKHLEGSDEVVNQIGALLELDDARIGEIKAQMEESKSGALNAVLARMPGYGANTSDQSARNATQQSAQTGMSAEPPAPVAGVTDGA